MNCSKKLAIVALATCVSALAASSASAQNAGYEAGNLILGFQSTGAGSGSYVLANIGDSSLFRDYTTNQTNIVNIGAQLTAQFGATWYDRTDLFTGAGASWSADEFGAPERNGDPYNTLYVANPRQTLGVAGSPGSNGFSLTGDGIQQASNGLFAVGDAFETLGSGAVSTINAGTSFVDYNDQNPIGAGGVQGNSYNGVFSGGVQYAFGAGTLGSIGGINAEAALDLYRIDSTSGQSTFEGTIVIDNLGNVSFINQFVPVPEPSTALGFGLLVGMVGLVKRRRTVVA